MSRKNDNNQTVENQADPAVPDSSMLTIEEHCKTLNIDAPIFAAVMQFKGWALEKTVSKADFEEAVKSFLNSPVGGA